MPKKKILLVEDETTILKILSDKLTSEGYNVLETFYGDEGLNIALKKHPNLIILSVLMPKLNAIDFLKKLRKNKWGKKASVIILTNFSNREKEDKLRKFNIKDYIIKSDYSINEIIIKIKKHT